ncbi:MAG: hypothetical protein AAGJ85_03830 [Pseudomonadota bacterium]
MARGGARVGFGASAQARARVQGPVWHWTGASRIAADVVAEPVEQVAALARQGAGLAQVSL